MKRLILLLALLGTALLLAGRRPARAQEPVPTIVVPVSPGRNPLAVAVPEPVGGAAEARDFAAIVRRDLDLSGWFQVIPPAAYIEPAGTGLRPGQFRFEDWDVPGATVLAKTGLRRQGDALRAEVWVYDVAGRRKLGARAFSADPKALRILAHKVANEIILRVTGRTAPFDTRFAFAADFTGNKEIYVCDFDGQGLAQITRNGSINIQPAWDPTGSRIAFTSYLSGNPDTYIADLRAGRITRLSARAGINSGPSFSPDGRLIALTLSPGGDPDIFTLDARTGAVVARLTRSVGIDVSPVFSPDGSRIAFVSERSGGAQIYVMNADGTGVHRVSFQGNYNTDPAWSPDGTTLAFVGRDVNFDVFTVRADGTGLTRITQDAGDNEDPSWSPDGAYIAFSSTRTGASHIWMATADGVRQVQLTRGAGGYTNPAWSPSLHW